MKEFCKCEEELGTNNTLRKGINNCSYCKEYVEACTLGEFK